MAGSVYSHATYPPVTAKDNELGIFSVTKYIMRLQIFSSTLTAALIA